MQHHQDHLTCDLITEPKAQSGQTNMLIDEGLLEKVIADPSRSIVRIYRWAEPTVSLGYFQKQDAAIDERLAKCPRVRRMTGGGAILHDQEITYSCAVPATHAIRKTPTALYELTHSAIIDLLTHLGVNCSMRMNTDVSPISPPNEPFLCFLRSDPRDIVCGPSKIVGSAQRRRRGHILQHGSVLLKRSELTPEIPGILDLYPDFEAEKFIQQIGTGIQSVLTSP